MEAEGKTTEKRQMSHVHVPEVEGLNIYQLLDILCHQLAAFLWNLGCAAHHRQRDHQRTCSRCVDSKPLTILQYPLVKLTV